MKVISANGNWVIQSPRTENQLQLQMYLSTIHLSDEEDLYEWTVNGTQWDKFKTGSIYSLLKRHAATVPWYQTIWCKRGIPKHNFLSWLFVLNRCPTRDRLLSWGLNVCCVTQHLSPAITCYLTVLIVGRSGHQ